MQSHKRKMCGIAAASILALAVTQAIHAESTTPTVVSIAGATLFENFFKAPGSTNDYIDVNNDGVYGYNSNGTPYYVQQLAPTATFTNGGSNVSYATSVAGVSRTSQWTVVYRGTGSVEGIQELLATAAGATNWSVPRSGVSVAYVNTTKVVGDGAVSVPNSNAVTGIPNAIALNGVDIATSDVRSTWAVQASGTSAWNRKPTQAGYGTNSVTSSTGQTNQLASLTSNGVTFNLASSTTTPDNRTVYDTAIAIAPINIVANPGVGTDKIKASELQHLYVTGRMANGENLVAVTRSVVSGTRNAAMNSLGIDPSYGVGENIGTSTAGNNILGATYQPGNYAGSGDLETGLTNTRLGIGYDGSDRAQSKNGAKWGSMQVMFDTQGGTEYVTSSTSSIIHNGDVNTGWRISGQETLITVGDPNATAVNAEYPATTTNPQMANTAAAEYIRNIEESIANYAAYTNSDTNTAMPAKVLNTTYLLTSASDYVQSATDATAWVANGDKVQSVQDAALQLGTYNAKLVSDSSINAGVAPTRLNTATYSDGKSATYHFFDQDGNEQTLAYGAALNGRNKVAGDFNGTGVRNIGQIAEMMSAAKDATAWAKAHNSGQSGANLGSAAVVEILGDFNGDGNFDSKDVRYFADGLAIDSGTGKLDRKKGFTEVDNQWNSLTGSKNYFGIAAYSTGKAYAAGDARGDVAGNVSGVTAGAAPTGYDGKINAADIDYVIKQVLGATGQVSLVAVTTGDSVGGFTDLLTRANNNSLINVRADLSADMNGDLKINTNDVIELVEGILGTHFGDANLDGYVNASDFSAMSISWQQNVSGWASGDFNGDGYVNAADFNYISLNWQQGPISFDEAFSAYMASVPEPASVAIAAIGGVALLMRRRK